MPDARIAMALELVDATARVVRVRSAFPTALGEVYLSSLDQAVASLLEALSGLLNDLALSVEDTPFQDFGPEPLTPAEALATLPQFLATSARVLKVADETSCDVAYTALEARILTYMCHMMDLAKSNESP